jgi:putative rhamnosyltransferase
MKLTHVLITRFSYRGKDAFTDISGPTFQRIDDPLDPERLKTRFMLFEVTCLPSALQQSEQRFIWIVLIDRQLPARELERLRALTQQRDDTYIHIYDPQANLASLDWLEAYLPHDSDCIVTTNLDDDDALPVRFVEAMQERLLTLERIGNRPPIGVIGAREIVEWDLLTSARAPRGWKAPWHQAPGVASVGLSLFCKRPEFNFCVLCLRHRRAPAYLNFSRTPRDPNVLWFQDAVFAAARRSGIDLRKWKHEDLFYDLSHDVGPVLMTNHSSNDQVQRLLDPKPERTIVTGPGDFPGLAIDWEKARFYAGAFRG